VKAVVNPPGFPLAKARTEVSLPGLPLVKAAVSPPGFPLAKATVRYSLFSVLSSYSLFLTFPQYHVKKKT